MESDYLKSLESLRSAAIVVIPAYFPATADPAAPKRLLVDTVGGCCEHVGTPSRVYVSVDGPNPALEAAAALKEQLGVTLVASPVRRGKLAAIQAAVRLALQDASWRYVILVDQDGDHFPNELANLVRGSLHAERAKGADRVLVLGRRATRSYPLGFLRGEMEELVDRILLDCLSYHAAVSGVPLNLEYALHLDEFPDFHSGFKLLTRAVAAAVFEQEIPAEEMSEQAVYRHAVEAVITVEALLAGASLVSVARSTFSAQPVSAFGALDRRRLMADKIVWPCRRLGAPGRFALQWFDNHAPRLRLATMAPQGRAELLEIRRLVGEAFGQPATGADGLAGPAFF
jgi:hypothetical protein